MFNIFFDVATAYLVAGFLYIALPITVWFVMGSGRSTAAGIWSLGGVLLGVGTLLLAFRRDWPEWAVYVVPNALFYAGAQLHIAALRLELGEKPAWSINVIAFIALIAGQEFVRLVIVSPELRFSWILTAVSVMLVRTMWLAYRLYKNEGSFSARWLAYVHGFMAMVLFSRVLRVLADMTLPDPLHPSWDSALTTLGMCVMSVFGSVAILGLYFERSKRQELASAFEREQIQARKRVEHELAHLDRQRSLGELAAAMAHEISQPLTAVSVECGLLQREVLQGDPRVMVLVDRIGRNVDRAKKILHGIRNFIQPIEPDLKPLSLLNVINEVMQLLPTNAKGSPSSMTLHTDKGVPHVLGDFVQLSQVVLNVLRNSEQAQEPEAPLQIVLRLQSIEGSVRLSIEDNGPGFSPQALKSAGQAFSTTKTEGMGIGIAISRRIIESHGGTLRVGNKSDGVGARVFFDLPAINECN